MAEIQNDVEAVTRGGAAGDATPVVYFESLEGARRLLTPQRILLLRVIRRGRPGSVYELAAMLGRDRKAVAEDLKVLGEQGLVTFKTEVHHGRARSRPATQFSGIDLSLDW